MAGLEHDERGMIADPVKESPAGPAQPLHVSIAEPPTSFDLEYL
jgi:hypothetical protein